MKLSEFKTALASLKKVSIKLPNGESVPAHFHVTEVGKVTKHFIDCGGTERHEEVISLQLWQADDYDHRLHPEKLEAVVKLSEEKLNLSDRELEVEYQGETINKFGIAFDGEHFLLTTKMTDCLAKEDCGIPQKKPKVKLSKLMAAANDPCIPGNGCC
ncbi:MAG: DUF6428 family protein [Leeuwenhoekiella sp.]